MQMRTGTFVLTCGMLALSATPAFAQEQGDTGITMGYPASIGFVYHVTDRVAIRPEVSFSRTSTEIEQLFGTTESRTWSVAVGLSGLFYVADWDRVRAYVSPRYSYSHGHSTSDASLVLPESSSTTKSHLLLGSFGAEYSPHPHFSVFGEVGLGYSVQNNKSALSSASAEARTLNSRTGVGIVFYF